MEPKAECPHQCKCPCHTTKGMTHIRACCQVCQICGLNINLGMISEHKQVCHPETEQSGARQE